MVSVLNWCGRILAAAFNGIARFFVQIVILLVILFAIVLAMGDGLSGNMVLALDLRETMADSSGGEPSFLVPENVTVMNLVLALDGARRDARGMKELGRGRRGAGRKCGHQRQRRRHDPRGPLPRCPSAAHAINSRMTRPSFTKGTGRPVLECRIRFGSIPSLVYSVAAKSSGRYTLSDA